MLSVAFLAALAALALPPALADWTFTLSPSLDESRCVTSAGLGNPVRILPSDGSEAQRWMSWEGCGSRFWQAATGEDNVLQAGYGECPLPPIPTPPGGGGDFPLPLRVRGDPLRRSSPPHPLGLTVTTQPAPRLPRQAS